MTIDVSPRTPQPRVVQLAMLVGLGSGLIGSLVAQAAWANPVLNDTNHFLVAQQVVDGLPPPPPLIFGQESLPTSQQYVVVVNSNSDMVLAQVQQIYPTASFQDYNGQRYIQAGLYTDLISAQQQVSTLATSGISAQVASISAASSTVSQAPATSYGSTGLDTYTLPPPEVFPSTTVPSNSGSVEFGSAAPVDEPRSGSRSYYVIIPGSGQDISAITNQVARLTDGMGIDGMIQSGSSKGSHVRVGPFESRSAASRWTRYFRDFGMDARISYSR